MWSLIFTETPLWPRSWCHLGHILMAYLNDKSWSALKQLDCLGEQALHICSISRKSISTNLYNRQKC